MPKIKSVPTKNQISSVPMIRKPHRFNPGELAIREIARWQKSTELLIRELPFRRLVREIVNDLGFIQQLRVHPRAMLALQYAAEDYLTRLFQDTHEECILAARRTIMTEDMELALKVQKMRDLQREIDNERRVNTFHRKYREKLEDSPDLPEWEWDSTQSSSSSESSSMASESSDEEVYHHDTWSDDNDPEYEPKHK